MNINVGTKIATNKTIIKPFYVLNKRFSLKITNANKISTAKL